MGGKIPGCQKYEVYDFVNGQKNHRDKLMSQNCETAESMY